MRGANVLVVLIAALSGLLVAFWPSLGVIAAVGLIALVASTSAAVRFTIVVAGGIVAFRGSDQLDIVEAAYLVWIALCASIAVVNIASFRHTYQPRIVPPLLMVTAAMVAAIAFSLPVALGSGTPLLDWMRDAAPYGLLALTPLLALDGAKSVGTPRIVWLGALAGVAGSAAFAAEWVVRRGLTEIPFERFGLASIALAGMGFALAVAALMTGRPHRLLWIVVAALCIGLLLITGTRSAAVLLAAPLAMWLFGRQRMARLGRLSGITLIIGALLAVGLWTVLTLDLVDLSRVADRLASIVVLGSEPSSDFSYVERLRQIGFALSAFADSPMTGVGLGFRFEWVTVVGNLYSNYSIDTGLSLLAKFGIVGLALISVALGALVSFYSRVRDLLPEHLRLTLIGFAAIGLASLPLWNPLEDKGFALASLVLLSMVLSSFRRGSGVTTDGLETAPPSGVLGDRSP